MDNDLVAFRKSLLDSVTYNSIANNEMRVTSFVNLFAEYLADAGFVIDFTCAHYKRPYKAGRRTARVDGYSQNAFEETVTIVIAVFDDSDEAKNLTKTDAMQTCKECTAFIEESINGNLKYDIDKSDPVFELFTILYKGFSNHSIRKIKVYLITDKLRSKQLQSIESQKINEVTIDYVAWTIDRLYDNIKTSGETRDIYFEQYGGSPVKCLQVESNAFPCYMCAMPGDLLANLYEKLDSELLEGNVRSFLGCRPKSTNAGIRRTIVNEPDRFFVYNNGIAATASDVHTETKNGQLYLKGIVGFQIVNGGQTTASLYNSRYKDKSDLSTIFVPMKLTVVKEEDASEVIPLIAEYANTQTKVDSADFFSNHDFCIRMERFSRTCRVNPQHGEQYDTYWFFERAKGQYVQAQLGKTSAQIREFLLKYPKNQMFRKTDFAKFRNSWAEMPDSVSKGAQDNFNRFADAIKKDYETKEKEYNEKYFKDTVSLGILFHSVESLVSNQEWYQGGYRANIVTYSIALFSHLMKEQYSEYVIDFSWIWDNQQIPDSIINELVPITKIVYDAINDPNRPTENISSWCKKSACWNSVIEKCNYNLSKDVLYACISKADDASSKSSAKKSLKEDNEIFIQSEVCNYPPADWNRLLVFLNERHINITPDEMKAIKKAIDMYTKGPPNTYQSKLLYELRERALNEGYKLIL